MKNLLAIAVGLSLMLAALVVAAGSSSQDTAPRPLAAELMATRFHETPSATLRPTFTPIPTSTPRSITRFDPDPLEILDLLFQYPYRGAYILASRSGVTLQRLGPEGGAPALLITGNGATATDGFRLVPAAFGAVLSWENASYRVKYLHVQFGHRDARVSVVVAPGGRIIFTFADIGNSPAPANVAFRRTVILDPCNQWPSRLVSWPLDNQGQDNLDLACF